MMLARKWEVALDLKHVRSFLAVAHALSFSRAARTLHLSQPALSKQIQLLEADLGALLLDRDRRTVRLTLAGTAFLADSEALLQQVRDIELRVARISTGEAGHLRIGFVASATLEIVPAIVLAFRQQYPRVDLELKNIPTVQQVEALRNGTIDAGFIRMPLKEEGLAVTSVHRECFAIALHKKHLLARNKELSLADLAHEPFVAYGRYWAPAFYDLWTGICREAGFVPRIVQETAEMSTTMALVAAGIGVAVLPEGMTRGHRHWLAVKVLNRVKVRSEIGVAIMVARQTPLLQRLVRIAKELEQL